LTEIIEGFRPELAGTPAALETADFLLRRPPLPAPVRPFYSLLARAAVSSLPRWAREPLQLPDHPRLDATVGHLAGRATTRAVGWVMGAAPAPREPVDA
ncbi:DUF2236 domain-containing protein, partial [Georgenia sp. 10Sc9-8]|nr:DUF2236 domain-containing protein [Georgenia halotolerans]